MCFLASNFFPTAPLCTINVVDYWIVLLQPLRYTLHHTLFSRIRFCFPSFFRWLSTRRIVLGCDGRAINIFT